eukprot:CAMPEP_0182916200 /NCGR_PEP_ID=MMETSP0105_2-20130417/795_1 /TAXON_ID=81532 ORGANISM="Acanthoeca-like sp., Strain 10tr" /NCGR_SAMPLE_ID=MMETSP0105_2 /ASSEMBLY_ACC=CAM_ASM_000205 /LENGTH=374 /DNA_ID=CAMNT_0025053129 /DNA_START=21 /DNA_END=1145 /DNA_ORIENTATION=+
MAAAAKDENVFEDGDIPAVGPVVPILEPELTEEEKKVIEITDAGGFDGGALGNIGPATHFTVAGAPDGYSQRLARLQLEVGQLMGEIDAEKKALGDGPDNAKEAAELVGQVKALASTLETVELSALTETWNGTAPAALQQKLSTDLLADLGAARQAAAGKPAGGGGKGGDTVTYEVYYNPGQTKLADASRAAQLEERIAKLEKLLGTTSLAQASSVLKDDDADITLATAITKMSLKLDALTEEGAATVRDRLEAVKNHVVEVEEKNKAAAENAEADEQMQRIDQLYQTAADLDKFSASIPTLIERLTTLKAIHEKGADFAKTVAGLENTQSKLQAMFSNDKATLEKLSATFADNMAQIEANFKATEDRMKALGK